MLTASGFNSAVKQYTISDRLRPLTLDIFNYFLKLYVDMNKTIKDYNSFTFSRSQCRVPMLSTPEASRSRYTPSDLPEPDEGETTRLWQGFLLYELICRMYGVPCAMVYGFEETPWAEGLFDPRELGPTLPKYMREEVSCVLEYFQSQYDLAFNCLVEKFELAVGELGQQNSSSSPHQVADTRPIIELLRPGSYGHEMSYLSDPCHHHRGSWSYKPALLGASFLQRYLSWDSSCRLEFVRATYEPFCASSNYPAYQWTETGSQLDLRGLCSEGFGRHCQPKYGLGIYDCLDFDPCEYRMRAVCWIFWKNTDRLFLMNLASSRECQMSSEHYECDLGRFTTISACKADLICWKHRYSHRTGNSSFKPSDPTTINICATT